MNVLSVFDGIGTGRLALENAGISIGKYYSSEIEPAAITVQRANWTDFIELGDIREIKAKELDRIDLMIGGSPCQGFSRQGKGLNFKDERSKLFFEFARILQEIQEVNKEVLFMLENVCMKKEWENTITDILGVKPIVLNSRDFSAQNRPRTYWTNIEGEIPQAKGNIILADIAEERTTDGWDAIEGIKIDPGITWAERELINIVNGEVRIRQATKKGYIVAEEGDGINLSFPKSGTRRGRVIKGKLPMLDCQCNICYLLKGEIRRITITEAERAQGLPDGYTKAIQDQERRKVIGNGWNEPTVKALFERLKRKDGRKK